MSKSRRVTDSCLPTASFRGLNPKIVLSIAVGVIGIGYTISSRSTVLPPAAPTEVETAVAVTEGVPELGPGEQRELLLADKDALNRAVLWLARCVYSESDRRHEQELVAWVVRNRVETRYRGKSTYAGVVTDPFQFSGFNHSAMSRNFLLAMDSSHPTRAWRQALDVAREVILADPDERPFPITVRHFYSEQSLIDGEAPEWAIENEPVEVSTYGVDEKRFRFFDGVS